MREDDKNVGPNNKNSRRPYYNKRNRNKYSPVENDITALIKLLLNHFPTKGKKNTHEI